MIKIEHHWSEHPVVLFCGQQKKSQNPRPPSQKCMHIYENKKKEKKYFFIFYFFLYIDVLYLGFWDKDNSYNKNNNI